MEAERLIEALAIQPKDYNAWDVFYHFTLTTIRNYHPPKPREDAKALVDFACSWRPDLVLWDPWFPCGGVAAQMIGAAHARILMTSDHTAWVNDKVNADRRGRDRESSCRRRPATRRSLRPRPDR